MTDYRIYCLDATGHIGLADWIEAATDEDAVAQARRTKRNALKCEVWQRSRLVAVLNGQNTGSKVLNPTGESSDQVAAGLRL
jgi:hypothetical protein